MKNEEMEQHAFIGTDSLDKLFLYLQEYTPKELFLVRSKKSYETCGAKAVIDRFVAVLGCKVTEYFDFQENPKVEDMERGLALLHTTNSSVIVAIGGGSVLDMAKLIRFFYSYAGNPVGSSFKKKRELLSLIALPTTAGTGSEATHFAVLYKEKVKYSVEHDDMLPNYAIVYSPFTYNNNKYLTACTGFDALAQAIEAYWNVNACEESDKYAEKAIQLLWPYLLQAVNAPTKDIRNKISEGAYWAGKAINITKTTAPHAFSYPFTTYYGYPHGHAVALTFPYIAAINLATEDNRQKQIYSLLGIKGPLAVEDVFVKFISDIGLQKIGDKPFDHNLILRNINLNRLKNNPVAIDKEMTINLINRIK